MRFSFFNSCRITLVLAVLPTVSHAQSDKPGPDAPPAANALSSRMEKISNTPAPYAPPAANAGDISQASRDQTEGNITALVPEVLAQGQYAHHPFDAAISSKFLDRYLDTLDHWHLYFLQSDINQFDGWRYKLQTMSTNFSPSTVIFSRFIKRATERTAYVTNLLHTDTFEFINHERFIPSRHELPNPTNMDDAHNLWRQELRFEYLDEKLKEGDMTISGPASFDAQSNVVITLPLAYTNSVSAKAAPATATEAVPNRMGEALRAEKIADTAEERRYFEFPVPVQSLLPGKLLDQEHHAFGSITGTPSNVIVRLRLSSKETLRKITNNFYSEDGQRLGSIHFLHSTGTTNDMLVESASIATTNGAPTGIEPAFKLVKGTVELNRKDPAEIVQSLSRRYTGLLKNYNDLTNDDYVLEGYLTALTHAYDPHSDYMGHASTENFNIQMHLSLSGIGARLKSEDGVCKIEELVVEGPAAKSGQITNEDTILSVAQKDQAPVTVSGMPLLKVVEMIRGPKGTPVTLTFEKAHPTDPSVRQKTITLVRDIIKLEDQAAKVNFYETPSSSSTPPTRVGVIDLNSFYADTDPDAPGEPPRYHGSTSKDVKQLIARMKKENVDGIILDLRRNGGGFLEEAIRLTGLFTKGVVPVVQTREPDRGPNHRGRIVTESTSDEPALYDGPLIVLTSRFSASASEIVAGALQDYGRALIVGDKATFGKGTVQTVQPMSDVMLGEHIPFSYDPGSLKVTIKKFYRAGGSSTQSNGVASDIILPSILNYADVGESSLPNPLPWDDVPSADHLPDFNMVKPFLPELTKHSLSRRETDKDFAYAQEDIDEYRKTLADKSVSLNEAERLTEQSATAARMEARKRERAARPKSGEKVYEITLKNVDQPGLHAPEVKPKPAPSPDDDPDPDAVATGGEDPAAADFALTETRRIMSDYISLLKKKPLAAAAAAAKDQ